MNIGLEDTLPFGKFKGQKVADVLVDNASYLVWLRETRKKENADSTFFDPQVSHLLDFAISQSKSLRSKYQPWNVALPTEPVTMPEPVAADAEQEVSYAGAWGSF